MFSPKIAWLNTCCHQRYWLARLSLNVYSNNNILILLNECFYQNHILMLNVECCLVLNSKHFFTLQMFDWLELIFMCNSFVWRKSRLNFVKKKKLLTFTLSIQRLDIRKRKKFLIWMTNLFWSWIKLSWKLSCFVCYF